MLRSLLPALVWLASLAPLLAGVPAQPGFRESAYGSGLQNPTAIAFPPDGSHRIFVCNKGGTIGVIPAGGGPMQVFARISPIYTESECGLLGICFDPNFLRNRCLYVFATVSATQQRIFRLRDVNGRGVERVALPMILPTQGRNHDGGALAVGPDACLYWAVGDNGIFRGANADLTSLAAKVGRAMLDGTAPTGNPFYDGPGGPQNDYIWATGFRNPFTMAFQPRTGRLWLNVVGSSPDRNGFEQIFNPRAGEDGGWDEYEGNQPESPRYTLPVVRPFARPVLQYKTDDLRTTVRSVGSARRENGVLTVHTEGTHPFRVGQLVMLQEGAPLDGFYVVRSLEGTDGFTALSPGEDAATTGLGKVRPPVHEGCVVGGTFYEATAFPAEMRGDYFFGDTNSGNVWRLRLDAEGQVAGVQPFVTGASGITGVAAGPDGSLFYTEFAGQSLRRVWYAAPAELQVGPTTQRVLEDGQGIFSVRLPAAPTAPVKVTITPDQESSVRLASASTLTFTPANWHSVQAVRFSAPIDAQTADKDLTWTVAAEGYAPQKARLLVTDTSSRAAVLSTASLRVTGGQPVEFQVSLPAAPVRDVTLGTVVASGVGLAGVRTGRAMVFTPQNWNVPQTVRVETRAVRRPIEVALSVRGYGYFARPLSLQLAPAAP